jgi:hypothetical protein
MRLFGSLINNGKIQEYEWVYSSETREGSIELKKNLPKCDALFCHRV